jgi:hypothetical protein
MEGWKKGVDIEAGLVKLMSRSGVPNRAQM